MAERARWKPEIHEKARRAMQPTRRSAPLTPEEYFAAAGESKREWKHRAVRGKAYRKMRARGPMLRPLRRVVRRYLHEKCPPVVPECRFCSVGLPARRRVGKKWIDDPSRITGWTVIGPDRKETLEERRSYPGGPLEYSPARFPTQEEAHKAAEHKSEMCREIGMRSELLVSPIPFEYEPTAEAPEKVAPPPPPEMGPPIGPAIPKGKRVQQRWRIWEYPEAGVIRREPKRRPMARKAFRKKMEEAEEEIERMKEEAKIRKRQRAARKAAETRRAKKTAVKALRRIPGRRATPKRMKKRGVSGMFMDGPFKWNPSSFGMG